MQKNNFVVVFFFPTIHRYPHRNSTTIAAAASTVVVVVVAVSEEEGERGLSIVVCRLSFIYFDLIQLFVRFNYLSASCVLCVCHLLCLCFVFS